MKAAAKPAKQAAGAVLGYGRVSREGQDLAQQRAALRAAGCTRLFEEKASGDRWDRPELHRLLDHLREGDVVVVWKLDRLSRFAEGTCFTSWNGSAMRVLPFDRSQRTSISRRQPDAR